MSINFYSKINESPAPDKGSETVRKIRSRLNDYKDQASDELEGLATQGKKAFEQGRNKVKDLID